MRFLVLVALIAGCSHNRGAAPQAGAVPAPRAMAYDGLPLDRRFRVEAHGVSAVTETSPGEEPTDAYVARYHAGAAFRARVLHATDMGVDFDTAFVGGSDAGSTGLDPRPDATTAWSMLFGMRHSIPFGGSGVRLGLGLSIGFVEAPVNVDGRLRHDDANLTQLALVPAYRRGPMAFHLGATFTREFAVPDGGPSPQVITSGATMVVSGGATWSTPDGLHVTAGIAQPLKGKHGDYGLQLSLSIALDFGPLDGLRPTISVPGLSKGL